MSAVCLGCGCACDDIELVVRGERIVEARRACGLGAQWFGDGSAPRDVLIAGRSASLEAALVDAATLLGRAHRPLVYLAGDLTCEAQRAAVALADGRRALLDSLASDTVVEAILAGQRRGRASATLGEIRHRGDLIVFWAVDPAERYPRYASRYAVEPAGRQAPEGRKSRIVVAVDVGPARGPADADHRITIAPEREADALALMRAAVLGRPIDDGEGAARAALELARRMTAARYVVLVHDAEPAGGPADPGRAEALIALAQALNGPTRCALSTLRGGGNRSGAEAVIAWQTGFPFAVDFARGYPRYRPGNGATAALERGEIDAALVLGAPGSVPERVAAGLGRAPCVAIGPGVSHARFAPRVAIDTGRPAVHEGGMVMRMDDVPLPVRPVLEGPPDTAAMVRALADRMARP